MLHSLDAAILLWIQEFVRLPGINPLIVWFTGLGDSGLLWLIPGLLMLLYKPTRKVGLSTVLSVGIGAVFTNLLIKPAVARVRPYEVIQGLVPLVTSDDPFSFPSGHTTAAFAAGVIWFFMLEKTWAKAVAVGIALFMAFSRLYVGVHYPSDVLAGAVFGTVASFIAYELCQRFFEKHPNLPLFS